MRLKRLTLHGFKTFADKTEIVFDEGVTAVVGPNGSGKSNVVDSLLWCLGEQKASSLRASRAQDVIFAGSSRRKPLGMAEVSLTVDNEDRFLPLDFSEVTVTRRIYRSGEGEYLLNKTPCRLKDITDLFLDTGVGRGAYAIVNQSEIDSILSARPEDRRELFEEAAGIKKYRVRKREAQRKLEATEQNLLRIRDIASEIERSLGPLEAQSLTARRFNELTERLRQVEVGLLASEYKRFSDEVAELARTAENAARESERLRAEAATLELSARTLSERIVDVEAEMDRARTLQQGALSDGERANGRIALAAERVASANRTLAALEKDARDLADEKARYEEEARAREADAREAESRAVLVAEQLAEAERVARDADLRLADLSRRLSGQQADYLTLARRLAGRRAERDAVIARITRREKDLADLTGRADMRAQETDRARLEAEQMAGQVDVARATLAEVERALTETALPARTQAQEKAARLLDERTAKEKSTAEQAARLRALEETEAAQEGYFAGVRSVTRAQERGHISGRYDLVADLLRVPAHLDTAIEIALGGSLQDIVTDTQAEAKRAIAYLNETRGGRATFLPLDNLRDQEVPGSLRQASRQFSGVLGSAADLVDYDDDVSLAVRVLLARVLITDDLDTATRVSRQVRDWARIVTLTGEVVVPTGAITGGAQGRPGPNLLGRKREIAELGEAVRTGQATTEQMRREETDAKAELEAARLAVRTAEASVQSSRDSLRDGERRASQRVMDATRLQNEADQQRSRLAGLQAEADADQVREAELTAELAVAAEQDVGALATRDQLQEAQGALALERGEAQGLVRTRGAELASLRERARALLRDADRARSGALRATVSAGERETRSEEARIIIAQDQLDAPKRDAEAARAKAALADAGAKLEMWRERRQALLSENFQIAERVKAAERGASVATEAGQTARIRAARIEAQRDQVGQRLLDEYEMHPDIAVEMTGGAPVDRDTSQEIGRLRREIKSLGAVNLGAIEEWERVSERWRFLTEQQTDLTDARARLLTAIAEIDDSTRGVFEETFKAVSDAFGRLFTRLFGGGTTDLVLTDPSDILETGIEIWAQPPGKKRQNLSLLSGGERALTATALLFAFLESTLR